MLQRTITKIIFVTARHLVIGMFLYNIYDTINDRFTYTCYYGPPVKFRAIAEITE